MRRLVRALFALAAASGLVLVLAGVASARDIGVSSLSTAFAADGFCTLPEAIAAANSDTGPESVPGECPAGSGADTITFGVHGTIYGGGWTLNTDVTIDGGVGGVTIDASGVGGGSHHFLVETGATVTLARMTLTGGAAMYSGSIYNHGTLTVSGMTIRDNVASEQGGGIYNQSNGVLTVADSTISGNYAGASGGGLYVEVGSSATVTGSTISGNTGLAAAGIYAGGTLVLANSTVANNTADAGAGGIQAASAATVTILNATITGNDGTTAGDGLTVDANQASVTVRNTILAGNGQGQTSGQLDVDANNVSQASAAGLLGPLGDNGGPTFTARLLVTGTAAIDLGDDAVCAASPVSAKDQRGFPRPSGAHCDIGAVERDGVKPTATAPKADLALGASLSGATPRATLSWGGSDTGGSGVASYVLQRSLDGGAYVVFAHPTGTTQTVTISPGHTYRYQVAAVDHDGNQGDFVTSRGLITTLTQQSYAGITWSGTWGTASSSSYSGGSVRYAKKAGAWTRFLFTGRGVAFVSTRASGRGKAKIYINGAYQTTIDLGGSTQYRRQAWVFTWPTSATRTIKVVVSGTSGRPRVDVDAFVVLK